jgi:hypothetical protein
MSVDKMAYFFVLNINSIKEQQSCFLLRPRGYTYNRAPALLANIRLAEKITEKKLSRLLPEWVLPSSDLWSHIFILYKLHILGGAILS